MVSPSPELFASASGDHRIADPNRTGLDGQVAEDRAEQGGLAGSVGSDDRVNAAWLETGGHVTDNQLFAPFDREATKLDHARLRGAKISHNRNGTPTTAVTMPTGTTAPGMIDLDMIEAADSINAPTITDIGRK